MSQVSKFQKFFCSLFYFMILLLSMQKIRELRQNLQILVFTGVGLLEITKIGYTTEIL